MTGAPFPAGETVTRLRATQTVNRFSGNADTPDWSNPDELEIEGCAFNPGTSTEPLETGRAAVLTQPEVYAPADSDVLEGDRLVVRGITYEVEGHPADYRSPFTGWRPGLVVRLKAKEG